jgi:3-phenylpropionate/trans-cinnamate dioxygenase ferredoxin subunit
MQTFVDVETIGGLAPGSAMAVTASTATIALFNVDGHLYALDDSCVRCGSSLAAGRLDGTTVTCSGCDWEYDVTTGCVCGVPALQIDTFDVTVADSRVTIATCRLASRAPR